MIDTVQDGGWICGDDILCVGVCVWWEEEKVVIHILVLYVALAEMWLVYMIK